MTDDNVPEEPPLSWAAMMIQGAKEMIERESLIDLYRMPDDDPPGHKEFVGLKAWLP